MYEGEQGCMRASREGSKRGREQGRRFLDVRKYKVFL